MVENRKSETVQVEKVYKAIREGACDETGKPLYYDEVQTNEVIGLRVTYNNRVFTSQSHFAESSPVTSKEH